MRVRDTPWRLLEAPSAQDYLRLRGITAPEIVTAFRLGYAEGTLPFRTVFRTLRSRQHRRLEC